MTAHFIAKLVEKKLNDINLDNAAGVKDFNIADGLLNEYTRMAPLGKVCGRVDTHNFKCSRFLNFEITEIVYKYAKSNCDNRIRFENWYRAYGWMYGDKIAALQKYSN